MISSHFLFIHWHPDPEIFHIGSFGLRYYSLLFGAGIILAYYLLRKSFERRSISVAILDKLLIYVVVGTFIGARLGHCLFYEPAYYFQHPLEIILPWQGTPGTSDFQFTGFQGLASHGAAIGILIGTWLFSKKYKFSYLQVLDIISPYVPLAGACIRLGNLFNSEIIGKPTEAPWAFIFDRIDQIPRHPSQIYEAFSYFVLFIILHSLSKKEAITKKKGYIFGLLLIFLFSIRFLLEFFKADQEEFEAGMLLNMGQILSVPLILVGIVLILRKRKMVS